MKSALLLPLLLAVSGSAAVQEAAPDPAGLDFFEKRIRPVLADKCYKCHSADAEKIKGGLLLDTREGARHGGDNGPAVVPGDLKASLLIEALRYENKDFAMPPKKAGGKLPDNVIHDFEKWIEMGAPDPRETSAGQLTQKKQDNWETAKDWWAWRAPQATPPPTPQNTSWPKTDLDRFLLAALDAKGLQPVADADKMTLLRRVYFDLIGLPPPPEVIKEFYADSSSAAFEKLVDKLLASPQFGERWGRHWLDVARYAESSGKDANIAFPHAWRFRDYVIAAFNADKPYDQFIREQLAGDLLQARNDQQRAEQIVATGFLALGPKSLNEQNPRQFALDLADEQIDTMSQAFLGLTVACARCHDHKFDPIPQKEYYSLAGIFLSTDTKYGTAAGLQNRHATSLLELPTRAGAPVIDRVMPAGERERKETRVADLQKQLGEFVRENAQAMRNGSVAGQNQQRLLRLITEIGFLEKEIEGVNADGTCKPLAMGVQDLPAARSPSGLGYFGGRPGMFGGGGFGLGRPQGRPEDFLKARLSGRFARPPEFSTIADSPVYGRGEADKPGEKAPRGFITLLSGTEPQPAIPSGASGRRELADWVSSPQNPLTARVMVNRVWHWIFGQGLVNTPDNFGTTGNKPTNQALLDTLAVRFVENGWSVKKLVREIVLSHAYQISSAYQEKNFAADPENTLVWRMSKRRLDAECIRDAILQTSGQLSFKQFPGSVIAYGGDGPIGVARFFGVQEDSVVDSGARSILRSVYLPIARDVLPDVLAIFDFAEPTLVSGSRETTNVPSQALYMLNSPFVQKAAAKFAERVLAIYPGGPNGGLAANLQPRITYAYWMTCSRGPTPSERAAAADFFTKFPASWKKGDDQPTPIHGDEAIKAAWTSFTRALFASAEFRYLN
jgi:hypothetical protein